MVKAEVHILLSLGSTFNQPGPRQNCVTKQEDVLTALSMCVWTVSDATQV